MQLLDTIRERLTLDSLSDSIKSIEVTRRGIFVGLGYACFGAFVFVAVFTLKYGALNADRMAREAISTQDSYLVEFSRIEPQLMPPRVQLDYFRIIDKKTNKPLLLMGETDVRLSILPLLVGKVSVSLTSRMYGGVVTADLSTGSFLNTEWINTAITTDMVELDRIPQVREYDKSLKGFASISTSMRGEWASPLAMEGRLSGQLAQLDMENRFLVVKGPRLKGYAMELDCMLEDGQLDVRRFSVTSSEGFLFDIEGTVAIDEQTISKSKLDFTGRLLSPPDLLATQVLDPNAVEMLKKKQNVPLVVSGDVSSPRIDVK